MILVELGTRMDRQQTQSSSVGRSCSCGVGFSEQLQVANAGDQH